MSNFASINLTKFVDHDSAGNPISESWGIRVSDDYGCVYSDWLKKEEVIGKSPADIVAYVDQKMEADGIMQSARDYKEGIEVGGVFYTWAQLKPAPVEVRTYTITPRVFREGVATETQESCERSDNKGLL